MAENRRRLKWALMLSVLVGGCSETSKLEHEYDNLSKVGGYQLMCETARDLAELWAREGNMAKTGEWSRKADLDCAVARLHQA